MICFKKIYLVPTVIAFFIIFILLQFFFFTNLTESINPKFQISESTTIKFNRHIRGRTIEAITKAAELLSTSLAGKFIDEKIYQLVVPLDVKNNPYLINLLPFFDIKNQKFETELVSTARNIDTNNKNTDIRGIDLKKIILYQPDASGLFKCLNSNQRISNKNLNDNFCDCVDGTDEPGTSACMFSKFVCTYQNEILENKEIPSSNVDDGICDCCDGSDEINTKCPNNCKHVLNVAAENQRKINEALVQKKRYLAEGARHDTREHKYGPGGVFFLLSKNCFKIDWSEFTFEVCPFHKATQSKRHSRGSMMNIGHVSSLAQIKNTWLLKLSNGDRSSCSHPRQSEILFICGKKDELLSVEEPEKCTYKFKMSTPAAC